MARSVAVNRVRIDNQPYSLQFNGAQRVTLDTMGALGSSLGDAFSFLLRFRINSKITTIQYYMGTSNSAGGTYLLCGISRNAGNAGYINFQLRDNSGHALGAQISRNKVNDGKWHTLACTKDATDQVAGMKMVLDNVDETLAIISNVALTDPQNFNRAMAIGSGLGSGAVTLGWNGYLILEGLYQRQLTLQEISDWNIHRKLPETAFAAYPLKTEAGAGTAVVDSKGGHNGVLTSAAQWSTDSPYKGRSLRTF